jgi:hypothetical protein
MDNKIAIITFCLGKVPYWLDYFVKSCAFNTKTDWFLFTDCYVKENKNSNIKIIRTSLNEIGKLIYEKINVKVNIKHPYKLCEFRPAFGLIFNKYLRNYDYWGYCDIDLIFGDILFFLENVIKMDYHIISPHKKFIHGHLCILKNIPEVNNLFRLSVNYKEIFVSDRLHVFDERFNPEGIELNNDSDINYKVLSGINNYIRYKRRMNIISKIRFTGKVFRGLRPEGDCNLNDFNQIVNHLEKEKKIKVYRQTLYECDIMKTIYNKGYWKITWKDGKLMNEQAKELLYFHFQLSKYMNRFTINDNLNKNNSFVFESVRV